MGESRQLKDDNFESLEAFIRIHCRKIHDLKEMQKNSGAKDPVSNFKRRCQILCHIKYDLIEFGFQYNLKTWLKLDGIELPSIDECKVLLGNNLPNEGFVQAFYFNSTNRGIFERLYTDPMPGYYLTTDSIAVDLLVQLGFQKSFLELGTYISVY